jgi:glycine cleavage system H protein
MRNSRAIPRETRAGGVKGAGMPEVTVDKFTFRVPETLLFSDAGIWVAVEGSRARLGLSDFAQKVNGDIAFANVESVGTMLQAGDEFGSIETVKVNLGLPTPLAGRIAETNPLLDNCPEVINQDPYGKGWMVVLELSDPEVNQQSLLSPQNYLEAVKRQAEAELKK